MIKTNELRPGNKFQTVDTKQIITLKSFVAETDDYILMFEEGNGCYTTSLKSNQVEPIPLTPEILEKCGFERDSIKKFTHFNFKEDSGYCRYKVVFKKHRDVLFRINSTGAWLSLANLKHLHQLQNIYFALTGEDLEIKEPVNQ